MTLRTSRLRIKLTGSAVSMLLACAPVAVRCQTGPSAADMQASTPVSAAMPAGGNETKLPATTDASKSHKAKVAAVSSGAPVFPKAVSTKYASQKAGSQRRHTCLDQYQANKATSGNGNLKWVQKGGGYYSACSKTLKG